MLDSIHDRVLWMKQSFAARDARMDLVTLARGGELDRIDPGAFSDEFPKPVVANAIDNSAIDFMNSVAPLPALNCAAGAMKSENDKKKASKKNKAAQSYWIKSRLEKQMFAAADNYGMYGYAIAYVEPDLDHGCPYIYIEDSRGAYYIRDRRGRVVTYAKCWREKRGFLKAMFPDVLGLRGERGASDDDMLEVIRYCDDDVVVLYVAADRVNVTLSSYKNKVGMCLAAVAELPGLAEGGRYDGAIGPMFAHNRMRMYILEAADKSVHAPTWMDPSAQELPLGPDAVIQSDTPPQRVSLPVPNDVFVAEQSLGSEVRIAAKHPSVRDGVTSASVVTGKGVEALMGQFDADIKSAQVMLGEMLETATELAFRVDEAWFGNTTRQIQGIISGEPFEESWTPAKDIGGSYSVSVDYGFAAGLGAGQAVVLMLQMLGAGLVSKDMVRRNGPMAVDVLKEQASIEAEKMRESLLMAMESMAQALPQLAIQGMDASDPVRKIAEVIKLRQQGKSLEESVSQAFAPPEPETPAETGAEGGQEEPGQPAGAGPVTQDQAPQSLMNLMAGLRNGRVVTGANIQRQTPIS